MSKAQIILKKGKYDSVERRHPWIFSGAIRDIFGDPQEGDVVDVTGAKGEFFGKGHFQKGSISVRMLTFAKEEINKEFFIGRIEKALEYRLAAGMKFDETASGNAWRLIYGEGDQLPGLIVDFYNGTAVIQAHSTGFHRQVSLIAECLSAVLGEKLHCIVYKPKDTIQVSKDEKLKSEVISGQLPDKLIITEYGSKYVVDVLAGQKTGFFLDQRDNRNILSQFSKNRKVLNMFCYSGGFSVSALKGGATLVHSVDSSAPAIELTKENLTLNSFDPLHHECFVDDAFGFLENMPTDYDIIVLDPPAYAKHTEARHRAVKGYQRLNALAISAIKPGGFIFTYSCSQVVDKRLFESTVMSAAIIAGRHIRIVRELTHTACHANAITHPEGKYLKGLLLYVE